MPLTRRGPAGRRRDVLIRRRAACLLAAACVAAWPLPGAAARRAVTTAAPQDWMSSVPRAVSSAPIRPPDGATVTQTPPDFSWPDRGPNLEYRITLSYPDGSARSRKAPANWIHWDEVLPAGRYSWQVQAMDADGIEDSRTRHFTVASCAVPFLVPDADELLKRAVSKPHPRALPDADGLAAMLERRRDGVGRLTQRVNGLTSGELPGEPAGRSESAIEAATYGELERIADALFAFLASGEDRHYRQALRRALNLTAWDPRGATSYAAAHQAARGIATVLTLAYDWLFPRLDAPQKRRLLDALAVRLADMHYDLVGPRARIAVHPYDSQGNHTLAFIAALSTVLAGDLPAADDWLRGALPLAISWTSPWGGEDGGFANGTAYAQWVIGDTLYAWNILRWTVGVDVARKAWQRNHGYFLGYFLPPGTPTGVFGDGAERRLEEQWARFGGAYARFAPNPLARWHASELRGGDPSRLHALLAPLPGPGPAPYPADTPDAAYFPSIGWVALHSDLADRTRSSVYFKSSFYGSYNHSHADQNSFVINSRGEALAVDSGYYDGYATPHWRNWYKQTKAHNAITFDGGRGQTVFEETGGIGQGEITRFEHHAAYDLVSGDATAAYGGALQAALRSLVYLRPDLVVVHDHLASPVGRRWEWNIHANERMKVLGDNSIEIRAGDERLCVAMLGGPRTAFTQSDRFDAAPRGTDMPPQWHGAFVADEPSTTADFVAVLGIGCPHPDAELMRSGTAWKLDIGGRRISFDRTSVDVLPQDERSGGDRIAAHPRMGCPEG
ncbi:MAG: heparinase II/III domain-containing protein [Woeseiaceae bacterium]